MLYVLTIAIAAVTASSPAVFPSPQSSATFHYVFSGHFWNGALVEIDRTDTLSNDSGTVALSKRDPASGATTQSQGVLGADGTVSLADASAPADPFLPYNQVALLARGARSYDSGATWSTVLPIQTGQTAADVTRVPIAATVAKADGDVLTVQGTGQTSAVSTYGEYRDPIDLTIQIAAEFRAGSLQRANYKATEYVHAGPLSQTMSWSWSLSAQ